MYDVLIDKYARANNISYALAENLIKAESGFNPNAISPKGAGGLAQLMPGTAKMMGVTNRFDPEQSIRGGLGYYAKMRNEYGPLGGLYAYNWGPGNYSKYLKGEKKEIPEETRKYVDRLGKYVDQEPIVKNLTPEEAFAPMDLQGRTQLPEVLPTAAPVPPTETGASKMDDYEQMKIFNPYVQMALGILAGNSGVNKSQAFANAMQGGLTGLNAAQRSGAYDAQVRAQMTREKRENDEYNLMKQRSQYMMDMAKKKLEDPNLSPDEKLMWEMASQGSLKEGVQLYNTMGDNKNASALNDIKLKMLEDKMTRTGEKGVKYELPLPDNHPFTGYSTDDKGELYDTKGIKLTGPTRDYVSQMIDRDPKDIVSLPAWKNKSDPTQIIPIKEYGRWINNKGENLNNVYQNNEENLTQSDIRNKGFRFVSEKQAENMSGVQSAVQQIKHIEDMLVGKEGIYTKNPIPDIEQKPLEAFSGLMDRFTAGMGRGTDPWQENTRLYNEAVDAFSSQLSKLQGQVGTLTELDVQKAIRMFPKLLPDLNPFNGGFRLIEAKKNEAQRQLGQVKEFLRSKGVDPNLVFGEVTGEKQKELIGHTPSGLPIYREN